MSDLADLDFDANEVEPQSEFQPLPAGEYDVAIISTEVKSTSNGQGKYLKLELQVCGGEYQNRKHFENLNLWNANAQTVQIAKASLSAICRAIGVMTPKDSQELVGKSLRVKMKVVEKKDAQKNVIPGEYQNRVADWKPRNGDASAPAKQPAPAGAQSEW